MAQTNSSEWRPILWPAEWTSPDTLRFVKGSAVDCLILPSAAGNDARWEPLQAEAGRAGLQILAGAKPGFPAPARVCVIEDGVWPRVARSKGDGDATEAGPTGLPWIDSNGWRIQLARARFPGSAVWVRFPDQGEREIITSAAYAVALADCEAHGGRWLIAPGRALREGLVANEKSALKTWQAVLQTVSFFRNQTTQDDMTSAGILGVLSDFAGDNEFLSHEFLNLIAREYVPVRILLKNGTVPSLEGLRLIAYLDRKPLDLTWKKPLTEFVRSGGTLVTDRAADPGIGDRTASVAGLDYGLRSFGRGRIAVAQDFQDPWRIAADSHILQGRAHDVIRQANAGSMNLAFTAARGGKRARVHLVNYPGRTGLDPVTLTFLERYRSARFLTPQQAPAEIPVAREYNRSAVYLPPFPICGTLELEA